MYETIEKRVRSEQIIEEKYGIPIIPEDERLFTTSQETDVREYIYDGLTEDEIIEIIKQW